MNNTIGSQLKIIEIIHLLQWPYWSCIKCLEMKNKIEKKHLLQFIKERDKMILFLFLEKKTDEINVNETCQSIIKDFLIELIKKDIIKEEEYFHFMNFLSYYELAVLRLCNFDIFTREVDDDYQEIIDWLKENKITIIGSKDSHKNIQKDYIETNELQNILSSLFLFDLSQYSMKTIILTTVYYLIQYCDTQQLVKKRIDENIKQHKYRWDDIEQILQFIKRGKELMKKKNEIITQYVSSFKTIIKYVVFTVSDEKYLDELLIHYPHQQFDILEFTIYQIEKNDKIYQFWKIKEPYQMIDCSLILKTDVYSIIFLTKNNNKILKEYCYLCNGFNYVHSVFILSASSLSQELKDELQSAILNNFPTNNSFLNFTLQKDLHIYFKEINYSVSTSLINTVCI
ncbi:hypothetical protein EHI8A_004240 [Entamoeba histolytica HM-1:IMSS-B]|uniref:Uncharacterized protein n=5 Tax=Entamoeba histolytica TaxID=5759 RepID=B1N2I8_ENTH1|nr:hypothetical protein EHI_012560 [Entamoeba histolytica HM-1:IMSS]EMD44230.1 Hypothetical protein EHI5A_017630 [Entamoeba histolytica KU27]EMH72068.1 hypothetical protein EHI8A_004240 [Entamoeba histolytica HM-1:IMSS-B]EMS16012.1 hypothetical protein KM1_017880 [Entamoeba histolytica HM-3:IMSS]ENY65894.1 hypothetical protein EHI7A_006240 [Entamoeba histolytica HM-1:IMSS-A]EDS89829.1 hypothetical protein EHI_012560 [Entamoeba histolytica HM-1:IMSS]|eukprot:XP_001913404.1 hypothetical protein EHI_012560 [Entamoeba histolytica HM-1:IMSS]